MYAKFITLFRRISHQSGLTLVELMVVIAILSVLLGFVFFMIDPKHQLNKVDDARRRADIQQVRSALDTYYNDHNCYPTYLPFGSPWVEGSTTYMRQIPQDIACAGNVNCYVYKYYGTCPQWSVVFTKLSTTPTTPQCSLAAQTACVPADYTNSWACVVSGSVDSAGCAHIASGSLSSGSDSSGAPASPTPNDTPTPTPTPFGCSLDYACSSGTCNHVTTGTGTYCAPTCNGACVGH